jgi:hypothetical protein
MNIKYVFIACAVIIISAIILTASPAMNLNFLTNGTFEDRLPHVSKDWGATFVFQPNGTYSYSSKDSGGELAAKGTFTIAGNAVNLTPNECLEKEPGPKKVKCAFSLGARTCTIKETPGDLYYEHYLVCVTKQTKETASFHTDNAAVKSGCEKKFKGIPVVTMGMVQGVTTASVKIRETPSVTGKALTYAPEPYGPEQLLPSVPDKTPVTIIARTKEKHKVQNWENYWYLVDVGMYNTAIEVWMFGEFVKMK